MSRFQPCRATNLAHLSPGVPVLYSNLNSACSLVVLCSCVVKFSLSTVSLGQCSVRVTSASLFAPLSTKCYTFVICKKFLFTVLSGNFAGGELKCLQSAQFGKSFFLTKNTNVCRKNKGLCCLSAIVVKKFNVLTFIRYIRD